MMERSLSPIFPSEINEKKKLQESSKTYQVSTSDTDLENAISTVRGHKLSLSEDSREKGKFVLNKQDFMTSVENVTEKVPVKEVISSSFKFKGFTSAKGNAISVSKEALVNVKNIFQDDDLLITKNESISGTYMSNTTYYSIIFIVILL